MQLYKQDKNNTLIHLLWKIIQLKNVCVEKVYEPLGLSIHLKG